MRSLLFIGFVFLFFANTSAQLNHYIYIQTENKQSFYVSINDKVYSSSASGYLIISKLADGIYHLTIGFPKNEMPQQHFSISLNNKDMGFILKNFDTKGWGLFNMETMDVAMATDKTSNPDVVTQNKNDAFSNMLADVVNTPSIKEKDEIKKTDQKETLVDPAVEKIVSLLDNAGRSMVYVVHEGNKTDTIRVFIPSKKVQPVADSVKKAKTITKKEDAKFIDMGLQNPNSKKDSVIINTNCKRNATQDDFVKLRKEMVLEDTDEAMLAIAKRAFSVACYSTEQVKNLSVLFLKDESKYNFFDAAYPYVNDAGNFNQLEKQLTDPFYIGRFKSMIRH